MSDKLSRFVIFYKDAVSLTCKCKPRKLYCKRTKVRLEFEIRLLQCQWFPLGIGIKTKGGTKC